MSFERCLIGRDPYGREYKALKYGDDGKPTARICDNITECQTCGHYEPEYEWRKQLIAAYGLTRGKDGLRRLIIRRPEIIAPGDSSKEEN